MGNKVLIIGPNYFNFLKAAADAFEALGWTPSVLPYDTPINPYTTLAKWRYRLGNKEKLQADSRRRFALQARRIFDSVKPDFVFIMNGEILDADTLDYFRSGAKVALWMFDSRHKLPAAVGHADHVDAMFCFEQDDVDWYADQGKKVYFLPQACDDAIYRPLKEDRDIDILFIGNLFWSPRRKRIMNAVIERYPKKDVVVYGLYHPWFKGIKEWLKRPHKGNFRNMNVTSSEANFLYNKADIVLNIHQESQLNGANPRVFEICGSGAYQICDRNPYIESLFPEGSVGLYGDMDELFERIDFALHNNMQAQAQVARKEVLANHTYRNRIAEVLKVVFDIVPSGEQVSLL